MKTFVTIIVLTALLFGEQSDTTSVTHISDSTKQNQLVAQQHSTNDSTSEKAHLSNQTITGIADSDSVSDKPKKLNLELSSDSLTALSDTVSVENEHSKHRVYNYRYQIISGVAMMLFFGLMIGSSESLNPQ